MILSIPSFDRMENIPTELQQSIHEGFLDIQKREAKNNRKLHKAISKISRKREKKLIKLLGSRKLKKLNNFKRKYRIKFQNIKSSYVRNPTKENSFQRKLNSLQKSRKTFLNKLGIDLEELHHFEKLVFEKVENVFTKYKDPITQVGQVLDHGFELTPHIFKPPFSYRLGIADTYKNSSDFTINFTIPPIVSDGRLRASSSISIFDPGGNDIAYINCKVGYLVYYKMPINGKITVKMRYRFSQHINNGKTEEEPWDLSAREVSVNQYYTSFFEVFDLNNSFESWRWVDVIDFSRSTYIDEGAGNSNWNIDTIDFKDQEIKIGSSKISFSQGQILPIWVGLELRHRVFANDVEVISNVGQDLMVKEIIVSTG